VHFLPNLFAIWQTLCPSKKPLILFAQKSHTRMLIKSTPVKKIHEDSSTFCWKINWIELNWIEKNVSWHFGYPPPLCVIWRHFPVPTFPRVSRIIWMAPCFVTHFLEVILLIYLKNIIFRATSWWLSICQCGTEFAKTKSDRCQFHQHFTYKQLFSTNVVCAAFHLQSNSVITINDQSYNEFTLITNKIMSHFWYQKTRYKNSFHGYNKSRL